MSYRFKSKKFRCLDCKTTFSRLVQGDEVTSVNCKWMVGMIDTVIGENCGKASNAATNVPAANNANKEEVKGGVTQPPQSRMGER